MFASSLSMASIHWKADDWSLAQLLKEGHVTTAVATLAYLPETESVTQVFSFGHMLFWVFYIRMCYVFLYLRLFRAIEHASHGKAL